MPPSTPHGASLSLSPHVPSCLSIEKGNFFLIIISLSSIYFKLPYILTHRSFVNISQLPFLIGVITILLLFPLWSQLSFRCICKRNVPSNTLNLNRIYIPVNIYIWFIQTWINQILCWNRYYWVTSTFFTTPLKMIGKNNTSCFPSIWSMMFNNSLVMSMASVLWKKLLWHRPLLEFIL